MPCFAALEDVDGAAGRRQPPADGEADRTGADDGDGRTRTGNGG
jgi:hypothetical protein